MLPYNERTCEVASATEAGRKPASYKLAKLLRNQMVKHMKKRKDKLYINNYYIYIFFTFHMGKEEQKKGEENQDRSV